MPYADVEWVASETDTQPKFAQMIENALHLRTRGSVEPRLIGMQPFVSRGVAKSIGAVNPSARFRLFLNGTLVNEGAWFSPSVSYGIFGAFNHALGAVPTFKLATLEMKAYARASGGGAEQDLGPVALFRFFPTPDHGLFSLITERRLLEDRTEYDLTAAGWVNVRLRGLALFTHRIPIGFPTGGI